MLGRVTVILLGGFWITMNVLLWRAEYGGHAAVGTSVPAKVVWEKILTSPDSSSLTIWRKGKKIGFCHWITSVSEDLSKISSTESPPEGMVRKIVNYRLELEGNVMLGNVTDRLRFDTHLTLGRDEQWQSFDLRLNLRPSSWQIQSAAADRAVKFSWQDDTEKFSRTFTFSELEHPENLVRELGGPVAAAFLSGSGLFPSPAEQSLVKSGLKWEARNELVRLGHSSVRAYRLETRLMDRFDVVLFISRAGELLRVELPEGIVLANDQLGGN